MNFHSFLIRIKGVGLKERLIFTRNLALIIKTGMSLPQGLKTLAEQSGSSYFQTVIREVREEVTKGKEFSEALFNHKDIFSPFYVSMVKTGEASGSLEHVLESLTEHMAKDKTLRSKILGALMYPMIILIVMLLVVTAMMIFAVPNLIAVFEDFHAKLPLSTRIVIGISGFLTSHTILFFIIFVSLPLSAWYGFFQTSKGKIAWSWMMLHFPLAKTITKKIYSARIARTLYTLISSGMPILQAISITSEVVQNYFYKELLAQARIGVEKGEPLNKILKNNPSLFPPLAAQLVAIGEETGSLDVILNDLAIFYEEEVDNITKNLSSIIEPLLMVIIGVGVGFFAISMLQPIYSLTNSIQ